MPPDPARIRSAFATNSILGRFGVGGPGAYLARVLHAGFGPARVLARGDGGTGLPPGAVVTLRPSGLRKVLAGTRFQRLLARGQRSERLEFDRWASRRLPPCDLAVLENSTSLLTMRAARRRGARIVLKVNNHAFRAMKEAVAEEERRWGGPPFFIDDDLVERTEAEAREADLVFGMSESVLESLRGTGVPPGKLRRARYGVDAERFRPSPGGKPGFVVAFVGWLDLRKGYPYLVEAFRDAAIPGAELLLHGGSGDAFHHGLVERLRGKAAVRVVRGPVEETYARASVTVLPSVSEAFGNVVPESMACGMPVIVTDRCGSAECVTDGVDGFVIPARDPAAIRDRLRRLHDDPALRHAMGGAARAKAQTLPWSLFQEDMKAILNEVETPRS